jgi:3-dehydroquinate synthase
VTVSRIHVGGPSPYDVIVGPGVSASLPEHLDGVRTVCVVVDIGLRERGATLQRLLADAGTAAHLVDVPRGEAAKDVAVLQRLWAEFAAAGLSRSDAVVAVGGGATTDVAGFAAATWMRGVRVVHVPTTLLGMVDAAVGGKTGINTAAGKNMVGAFHPPAAVLVDLDVLSTLPGAEWTNGMAEVIKAGFVADPSILDLVRPDPVAAAAAAGPSSRILIERSVAMKAAVVSEDLTETGRREILNYGHTLGHALERREDYQMPHGHAVSIGMVFAAELSRLAGRCPADVVADHRVLLGGLGLPTSYDAGAFDELLDVMRRDKKARAGRLRFVVLDDVGQPGTLDEPDVGLIRAAYEEVAA